jgi:hypothetical protein
MSTGQQQGNGEGGRQALGGSAAKVRGAQAGRPPQPSPLTARPT